VVAIIESQLQEGAFGHQAVPIGFADPANDLGIAGLSICGIETACKQSPREHLDPRIRA